MGKYNDECACLIPYKLHVMPADGPTRLEWIKAINRKTLPKKVFVCSEHFLDGMPTERNPFPKLKLGYENNATPGRRKLLRQATEVKKRKLIEIDNESDIAENKTTEAESDIPSESSLPEAYCQFLLIFVL